MNSTISKLVPGPGEGILANLSTFALKNGFFFQGRNWEETNWSKW